MTRDTNNKSNFMTCVTFNGFGTVRARLQYMWATSIAASILAYEVDLSVIIPIASRLVSTFHGIAPRTPMTFAV